MNDLEVLIGSGQILTWVKFGETSSYNLLKCDESPPEWHSVAYHSIV